jgi:hypothetical protein
MFKRSLVEWERTFVTLRVQEALNNWAIGDAITEATSANQYGETMMLDIAVWLGKSRSMCYRLRGTALAYPNVSERTAYGLPWSYYATVASFTTEERRTWLKRAAESGMSLWQFQEATRRKFHDLDWRVHRKIANWLGQLGSLTGQFGAEGAERIRQALLDALEDGFGEAPAPATKRPSNSGRYKGAQRAVLLMLPDESC